MADQPRPFIALYTDEDVTSELAKAVRQRGFSAQSTAEAGMLNVNDEGQLAYAAEHGMTVLTYNARDFLRLAQHYASSGKSHAGIVISSEQYTRREFGQLLRSPDRAESN